MTRILTFLLTNSTTEQVKEEMKPEVHNLCTEGNIMKSSHGFVEEELNNFNYEEDYNITRVEGKNPLGEVVEGELVDQQLDISSSTLTHSTRNQADGNSNSLQPCC